MANSIIGEGAGRPQSVSAQVELQLPAGAAATWGPSEWLPAGPRAGHADQLPLRGPALHAQDAGRGW